MDGILGFLAITVATTLAGAVALFYLGVPIGKQARYLGLAILRPLHILHGRWLCPACLGAGEGNSSELIGGGPCFFCLRLQHLADGTTTYDSDSLGFVSWSDLRHGWDWRHWCAEPRYLVP
jgi:hypothetical protein